MVQHFYTPREHHNAGSPAVYREHHARHLEKRARAGQRDRVHRSTVVLTARIDCNTWLVDCECGAGNAVDPDWPEAHCFGCGAIHSHIVFPDPALRKQIEAALLRRVRPRLRSWQPGETVETLLNENVALPADERTTEEASA